MRRRATGTLSLLTILTVISPVLAQGIVPDAELDRLALSRFWSANPPLPAGESVAQHSLVGDNIYLLSPSNIAVAVHTGTGVIRWAAQVAEPGQSVRGPTHSSEYVFFTGSGSVKVLDRRTGELAGEPRQLNGVIITVEHDVTEISIGSAHGVRLDDILDIYGVNDIGRDLAEPIAKVKITVVSHRKARGEILRESRTQKVHTGDRVRKNVRLPLREVKLPFAASSPAVADEEDLFVGAANERMYSLRFLSGFENWRVLTPKNMSAQPVLFGDSVYFCDNNGRCASATKRRREKNWEFYTEGSISFPPVVTETHVFVASDDRSLYCLNRQTGRREWQKRFDERPDRVPVISGDLIYQHTAGSKLFAVKLADGSDAWSKENAGRFMMRVESDTYLWNDDSRQLVRVNTETGETKSESGFPMVDYAEASANDQLIVFGRNNGSLMCARPKKAPFLRAKELSIVLQNDRKAAELNKMLAEERAKREAAAKARAEAEKEPERPTYSFLEEDDYLTSRSDRAPAKGIGKSETEKPAEKKAESKEEKKEEKKAEEEPKDDWGDDDWGDDGDKDKEKDKDKEDEGGDDEGDDGDDGDDDW